MRRQQIVMYFVVLTVGLIAYDVVRGRGFHPLHVVGLVVFMLVGMVLGVSIKVRRGRRRDERRARAGAGAGAQR